MKVIDFCLSPPWVQKFTMAVLQNAVAELRKLETLPILFMRLLIKSLNLYPVLKAFAIEVLGNLMGREIWKTQPQIWKGCVIMLKMTQPQSHILHMKLPAEQLRPLLESNKELGPALQLILSQTASAAYNYNQEAVQVIQGLAASET